MKKQSGAREADRLTQHGLRAALIDWRWWKCSTCFPVGVFDSAVYKVLQPDN